MNEYCYKCELRDKFITLKVSNDDKRFKNCMLYHELLSKNEAVYERSSTPPPVSQCLKCFKLMKEHYCSLDEDPCINCLYKVKTDE